MEIYYNNLVENFNNKDLMEIINNKNLREKLMQLVNEHKIIVVKGLSSAQRHTVYRQMYYPLKFKKIVHNEENTDIKIYNCKIKQKEKKQINETNEEKTEEIEKTEDKYLEEESSGNSGDSEIENESDNSYLTEEGEQLKRLEDIGSQILERVLKNEKKIDKTLGRVNLVIQFNIIVWVLLYSLDPVRVIHIRTKEWEVF